MATSLRPSRGAANYPKRDRVAEALARRLSLLPSSARQILVGSLNYRVAEVIGAFDDAHEVERRERWLLPIRAAFERLAEESLTRALVIRAQQADASEDVAESAYLTDPSPATRDAWIRALDQQAATNLALRMALVRDSRELRA